MRKTFKTHIICKANGNRLNFFARCGGEEYYLFSQKFNRQLFIRFCKGIELDEALTPGKRRNVIPSSERVSDKLPAYIRFIEREYGVQLMHGRTRDPRIALREKAERRDLRYAA